MRKLRQITVVGLGLLGSSITLGTKRASSRIKTVGYSHRAQTRQRARRLGIADEIMDNLCESVSQADIVILASPITAFEDIFAEIASSLPAGAIVTDVGSTKCLPHRWAKKRLGKDVHYVGSHPMAGSEQRGVEFARDDLFDDAACIITKTDRTNASAVRAVKQLWQMLGCRTKVMTPAAHDKILGRISHLPHITAAALVNSCSAEQLKFTGKGFIDASRIASGPANIWADVLFTNKVNTAGGIDRIVKELLKFKKAIKGEDKKRIEKLLEQARSTRAKMLACKMKKKELI